MTKRGKGGEALFWQYARDFLHSYCPKIRQMSPKTIEAYRIGMECYIKYLSDYCDIQRREVSFDHFDRQFIKGYSLWMQELKNYSHKTVDLRLTILKSFLKFASNEDVSLVAIFEAAKTVKPPKQPKRPIVYMEQVATKTILAAFTGGSAKARRNRMLLILLYDSAARVSEIADATLGDLHLAKPAFISLTGKGNKTRNMPLMEKTVEHLKIYLGEFHPDLRKLPANTPLFYSNRDEKPHPLSTDSISVILKTAGDIARSKCPSVPQNLHCHLFRKTRAMDLYKEGVPLPLIMQMLGHESMSTTSSFYAFATMDMMAEAIEAANPEAVGEPENWKAPDILEALYCL
jgi:site-specific recombinase XerD